MRSMLSPNSLLAPSPLPARGDRSDRHKRGSRASSTRYGDPGEGLQPPASPLPPHPDPLPASGARERAAWAATFAYLQVYLTPVASSILRSTAQSFLYSIGMNLPSFLNSAASAEPSQGNSKKAFLMFSTSFGSRL